MVGALADATHVFYAAFQPAPGTAMSLVPVIAVYGSILKALGRPLAFPGRARNSLYQVTDSAHFADAAPWAATEPRCAIMADKAPLWDAMVQKHGLKPYPFDEIAAWPFGDYVFGRNWDVMSSVTKCRRYGFHDVVDSQEMFERLLARFRAERIVP